MKSFLIRCDVSAATGTGHLRRCLTLARELKGCGVFVFFACRSEQFDWIKEVSCVADDGENLDWSLDKESDAKELIRICEQKKIDFAIVDHYRADESYQMLLYEADIHWLQFDGAAKQNLWADVVLNASPTAKEDFYQPLKQRSEMRLLLGPRYALLRREFRQWQTEVKFRKNVRKILLTFGGGNDNGATIFCLESMNFIDPSIELVILTSSTNPSLAEIRNWGKRNNKVKVKILVDTQEIAKQMADADLAVTGGGTTTFETAAMGLPSLIVQIADNQRPNAEAWEQSGAAVDLGRFEDLSPAVLQAQVTELIKDRGLRKSMSDAGKIMVDCLGAQRVARVLTAAGN